MMNESLSCSIAEFTAYHQVAEITIILPRDSGKWRQVIIFNYQCNYLHISVIHCQISISDNFCLTYAFLLLFLCLDRRTDNWLLVHSPVPISCIFLCYLVTIWVGPKLMARRQPVNLKPVLIVYNFAMVCLSAYMFYEVLLY